MRFSILLIASACCCITNAKELKLLIWSDELNPIIYWNANARTHQGIVIDIFNSLPKEHEITLSFILHNRKRGEIALYEGLADVSIFSKEWMQHPEKLIYSEPIYVHREFLYGNSPIKSAPLADLIKRKSICTRQGYHYPMLEPYFTQKKAVRIDSGFELTQFKMLRKKRCDFVLANEFVGDWLIEANGWKNEVFRSPEVVDVVNFTFAFHPSLKPIVAIMNSHLAEIKRNGMLAQFINAQRSSAAFKQQAEKRTLPHIMH